MALRVALSAGYLACILAANWALDRWGMVPIGFSLTVPAGVYFAGFTFGLRDAVQEAASRAWVVGLIVVGAAASWLIDPTFAVASGTAFLLSEFADYAVYTPLVEKRWMVAVVASNIVGSTLDSLVFLLIAFGTTDGWIDLTIGKFYMTVPAVVVVGAVRRRRRRRRR